MSHETANVNGINIHYVQEGHGYPVLFLHGWPGFWYTWRKQIPVLSEKFQVIVPDLRGSGDSDKPRGGMTPVPLHQTCTGWRRPWGTQR